MHWVSVQKPRVAWILWAVGTERYRKGVQVCVQALVSARHWGGWSYTHLCQLALCVEVSLALLEVSRRRGQLALFQMAGWKPRTSQLRLAAPWH